MNAPDLYIPFMAMCTYVVLTGATLLAHKRFQPTSMYATVCVSILGCLPVAINSLFQICARRPACSSTCHLVIAGGGQSCTLTYCAAVGLASCSGAASSEYGQWTRVFDLRYGTCCHDASIIYQVAELHLVCA